MSKLVPKLRFKEFSGEWVEKKLRDIGDFKGGGTPSKSIHSYWKGDIPWISSSDIDEGNINYININKYINKTAIKNSATKIIPKNSILLISRVGVGKLAINQQELCTSQDFTNFISKEVDSYYLGYYFLAKKNILKGFIQGTSIKGFTKSDIEILKLPFPKDQKEQQKIANTLSSLDSLIEAHQRKVEALQKHKKGLMQQLFPSEGENVPKLRFKEFSGEWEEMKLGDIGEIITGNTPKTSESDNYGNEILFVSPADISENRYIYTTDKKLTSKGFLKTRVVKAKSILVVCIGSTIGKVAQNTIECATNQQINSIIPFKENCNDFIYSTLEKDAKKMKGMAGNHAVPIINKTAFSNILILLPKSQKEQQKIANTLSSLDSLIEAYQRKVEALQKHKKGLMQQMFVSGEG